MNEEKIKKIANRFSDQVSDVRDLAFKLFGKRMHHHLYARFVKNDEKHFDEFEEEFNLEFDETREAFHPIKIHYLVKDETSVTGFKYVQYLFFLTQDGNWQKGTFDTRLYTKATKEQIIDDLLDISRQEQEQFSKYIIDILNKVSVRIHEWYMLLHSILRNCEYDIFSINESTFENILAVSSEQESIELISKLKFSQYEVVKFSVIRFYLGGTLYTVFPVNDFDTLCCEYDTHKVILDIDRMMVFVDNLMRDNVGIMSVDFMAAEIENAFNEEFSKIEELVYSHGYTVSFTPYMITTFGKHLAFSQILNSPFDKRIITLCNFKILDKDRKHVSSVRVCNIKDGKAHYEYSRDNDIQVFDDVNRLLTYISFDLAK